jgi:beta-phosphoglucomutase
MPLNAVIFDMDGVLCATDDYHYRSWKEVVSAYGIQFTRRDNQELLGLTRRRSLDTLLKGRSLPENEMDEILRRKNEVFLKLVEQMDAHDLLPGVKELLNELAANQLRIGVASASRNTGPVLERLGIEHYMDAVIDGNTVRKSKPAPDVFQKTASALGVHPAECLVLEDSQAGVQAARAAGMCVVGLGPADRVRDAAANFLGLQGVSLANLQQIHKNWLLSIIGNPKEGKSHIFKGQSRG